VARSPIRNPRAAVENILLGAKIGDVGVEPDFFNSIAALAVAGDYLFVADNLNARIQIMLINPSAPDLGK